MRVLYKIVTHDKTADLCLKIAVSWICKLILISLDNPFFSYFVPTSFISSSTEMQDVGYVLNVLINYCVSGKFLPIEKCPIIYFIIVPIWNVLLLKYLTQLRNIKRQCVHFTRPIVNLLYFTPQFLWDKPSIVKYGTITNLLTYGF